jgi:putative oxidoreductase
MSAAIGLDPPALRFDKSSCPSGAADHVRCDIAPPVDFSITAGRKYPLPGAVRRLRYIGFTDRIYRNKSPFAMPLGVLASCHFQLQPKESNMSTTSIQSIRPSRRIGAWTLQGILAAAFLAAGSAKLAGVPYMVELFNQIGVGQWFRIVTGVVEVTGAIALVFPGLASIGAAWLGSTMVFAVATHVFILHTSPAPAIVLGILNALVVYLRRDELVALLYRIKG